MKVKTKKKICGLVGAACMLIAIGIVGGVETGAPLTNMIWAFVSLCVSCASLYKGGYMV